MPSANEQYADRIVGQSVDLHRLGANIQQEALGLLKTLETELVTAIKQMDLEGVSRETHKRARAEKMLEQTRATIRNGYSQINATVKSSLVDLAKVQAQGIKRLADEVFKGSVMTTSLTPQDLRSIVSDLIVDGNPAKEWWGKQAEGLRMNFAREVRQGLVAAETTDQIVRRIRGRDTGAKQVVIVNGVKRVLPKFAGGVMDVPTRQARALVRTAVQAVSNDVLNKTYEANSDVIGALQGVATLDERTCEECMALDGGLWDPVTGEPTEESQVKDPQPNYPLHIQCRCVLVPVTKSWEQLIKDAKGTKTATKLKALPESTRASMDGQVPETMTYNEWLKKQPDAVQKDVLGVGKHQLWKEGKITSVTQLTDQSGNTLTLKQLQDKFGD